MQRMKNAFLLLLFCALHGLRDSMWLHPGRTRQVLGKEQKGLEGTFGAQHIHGCSLIMDLKSAVMNISMTSKHLHQLTFLQFIFKLLNKMSFLFFLPGCFLFVCLFCQELLLSLAFLGLKVPEHISCVRLLQVCPIICCESQCTRVSK